jgi:hypothetical protein
MKMNDQSYLSNFDDDQHHQDTPSIERYDQIYPLRASNYTYTQDTPSHHNYSRGEGNAMLYHQKFQEIVDDLTSTRLLPNNLYSMGSQRTN